MQKVNVQIKQLSHGIGLPLPERATSQSAGCDLTAAVDSPVTLTSGKRVIVPTGIAIGLPEGYEAQIRPRSGLAAKHGITVLNSPGTIDADYRGEIGVILINHGEDDFTIDRGMRIAQMVIAPVSAPQWHPVSNLDSTDRGAGGFGSTGTDSIELTK